MRDGAAFGEAKRSRSGRERVRASTHGGRVLKLYAGIDAGQSGTSAAIADESGSVLARGEAGPADEVGADASSTRMRDALAGALSAAIREAGLPRDIEFERIVAGISGYEGRVYGQPPHLPTAHLVLLHDAPIAHAAAFDEGPGVLAIVGTGSVIYAVDDRDRAVRLGGRGYLFGDDGSAFWIAVQALRRLSAGEDEGRNEPLGEAALAFFDVPSLRDVARRFYHGGMGRERVAAFAQEVVKWAERGEPTAAAIVQEGVRALSWLVATAARGLELHEPVVALTGGMTKSPFLVRSLRAALGLRLPGARFHSVRVEPVLGALRLARRVRPHDRVNA